MKDPPCFVNEVIVHSNFDEGNTMKNLIQSVLVFTFALGVIFTTATSSYAVTLGETQGFYRDSVQETKKYKGCKVNKVERISPESQKGFVHFTDANGNPHKAEVDWNGSLRTKLEKAASAGKKANISINRYNQVTAVVVR